MAFKLSNNGVFDPKHKRYYAKRAVLTQRALTD